MLQANRQVDELKCKIMQCCSFSALTFRSLANSLFSMEKLLSTEAVVSWALSGISKLSLFLDNTTKKFWLITDNYEKLTLLPYKKNIYLTAENFLFLTYQIKNMKLTFLIQSSCKKSRHSSLLPKHWLFWKCFARSCFHDAFLKL